VVEAFPVDFLFGGTRVYGENANRSRKVTANVGKEFHLSVHGDSSVLRNPITDPTLWKKVGEPWGHP
jgi:hypothetical protein